MVKTAANQTKLVRTGTETDRSNNNNCTSLQNFRWIIYRVIIMNNLTIFLINKKTIGNTYDKTDILI